jgi:hypothetical protein
MIYTIIFIILVAGLLTLIIVKTTKSLDANLEDDTSKYKFSKATKIYYGLDHVCRCGCAGTYAYKDSELFNTYKDNINKIVCNYPEITETFINIPIGDDWCYTIHYD